MDAVLLVGGKGTRLRPLTATTPKPMLPAGGVPFITHQLARARDAGVTHVVLATSYKSEVFREHFGDGSSIGLELDYVHEVEPLGTGGGIRNVAGMLHATGDEPVVILNGDVLSGHDIAKQVELHRSTGAAVTLHLTEVEDPRAFGCVPVDEAGRVTAFLEKDPHPVTNRINAGCYVFSRAVIDTIATGRPVSVERETFPGLLADGHVVMGHVEIAYWLDLGTPAAFVQGACDLVLGEAPGALTTFGESLVLAGAQVASDAGLSGGTCVGEQAVIGHSTVHRSVVMTDACVGDGCIIRDSVVGVGAHVGDNVVLDGVIVGDGASIGTGCELLTGARVWPEMVIPEWSIRFSSDKESS
jgi:mannose-1-phosphate guanylyltransferase